MESDFKWQWIGRCDNVKVEGDQFEWIYLMMGVLLFHTALSLSVDLDISCYVEGAAKPLFYLDSESTNYRPGDKAVRTVVFFDENLKEFFFHAVMIAGALSAIRTKIGRHCSALQQKNRNGHYLIKTSNFFFFQQNTECLNFFLRRTIYIIKSRE